MRLFGLAWVAAGILVAGCDEPAVESYRVSKAAAPAAGRGQLPAGHPPVEEMPVLRWELPAGWQEGPPGDFRVASFKAIGPNQERADISIVPLPGEAGGDLGNVNRWRAQVGLEPIGEEQLRQQAEAVQVGSEPATLYDQGGEEYRIIAVIHHRPGMVWFYKMSGDKEFVTAQKPAFLQLLKSIRFGDGESAPASSATAASEPSAGAGVPRWQVPAGWQAAPAGQFLVAKFNVGPNTSVNVSRSVGDGGGLAANVNRWRGQLGLPELPNAELMKMVQPARTSRGTGALVELEGEDGRRLVAVVVALPEQTWFYKLMGEAATVAGQRETFLRFVETAQY